MAYSTVSGVRLAVAPGDYDATNPPGEPTNTCADMSNVQLIDAISQGDSLIDQAIAARYITPVAPLDDGSIPHPIDFWSRTLAVYIATLTFRQSQDFQDTDPVYRRYALVRDALGQIASGRQTLVIPALTAGDNIKSGSSAPYNQYPGTLFSPDDWFAGTLVGPVVNSPYWTARNY